MTNKKNNTSRRFIYTASVGSVLVTIILVFSTIWAARRAVSATDETVATVSTFYLESMADQRARTITNLINNNFEHMEKALNVLREDEINSQEELRSSLGRIKTLLSLNRFALVSEDNTVYTQYTTYSGGSRYDFLSDENLNDRVISTLHLYGSSKQLCLAIPTGGLLIKGKNFKTCFVQIDIDEISSLLAFEDQKNTSFCLYTETGGNLSDTELGMVKAGENLLESTKPYISQSEWEQLSRDFEEGNDGNLTLVSGDEQETLCYSPVPNTGWMLVVLIHENVVYDQIRVINDNNNLVSGILIVVTLLSTMIFASVLILQLRKVSKAQLEDEKKNSKFFRSMANTDSMTGVRNKHAYTEYQDHIDSLIRSGEVDKKIAVVMCDINGLKYVNDTKGHAAGDKLIQDASALICRHFDHGAVFRVGGDEFAVILLGKGYETMHESLDAINREVEANIDTDNVVVSVGYSVLEPDDRELRDAMERADKMMYERKAALKAMGAKSRES
ncbi:MAG: GGDEF domain-containing protein [Lachnospiraceae bacterium]|nr:GGDEF domain-containing protein [Lachnospiraceae bacterium]